jgi:spore germination protein
MIVYEVKPHDDLFSISQRYNVPVNKIISDNKLSHPEDLVVGQTLVLLPEDTFHTVRRGESLYSIAKNYGIPLKAVQAANPSLRPPYLLHPGMRLNIPMGADKDGAIVVNGYAFPGINHTLLTSTLPYLTYLSIFSAHARPDGSLIPVNDSALIQTARRARVAPMMVVTNMGEEGGFDSDLAHILLTDMDVQEAYIRNILQALKAKKYFGLDVDFEYVYPDDREAYNDFLRIISEKLKAGGYSLTTTLAPKKSDEQTGLLYTAHDYALHGEVSDHVILMTYEWGYTRGPAMAVSPLDQVRQVVEYAVSVIPGKKILMGIPNYGYDWTLPFEKGTSAQSLSNLEALERAHDIGVSIEYDKQAQAPTYTYFDEDGKKHEVWFGDARSIQAGLSLVRDFDLGGVSYWTVNRPFPQNWLVLNAMYEIKKVL